MLEAVLASGIAQRCGDSDKGLAFWVHELTRQVSKLADCPAVVPVGFGGSGTDWQQQATLAGWVNRDVARGLAADQIKQRDRADAAENRAHEYRTRLDAAERKMTIPVALSGGTPSSPAVPVAKVEAPPATVDVPDDLPAAVHAMPPKAKASFIAAWKAKKLHPHDAIVPGAPPHNGLEID